MTLFYTGVGSRETPNDALWDMEVLAWWLRLCGWTLRSGAAPGADSAFEAGAGCDADIYLPWPSFGRRDRTRPDAPRYIDKVNVDALRLAAELHPAWGSLSSSVRSLHARNCHQVLGDNLDTPSTFLVCWTADGCETEAQRTRATGGTGTAIALACRNGVPVFNLARPGRMLAVRLFAVDKQS